MSAESLLTAQDIVVEFPRRGFRSTPFQALKGVSLDIHRGETVGLVGESGSGKTTFGRAILGLVPVASGALDFDGRDITHLSQTERRAMSRDLQVVFQDPFTSLNPSMSIGDILGEPLLAQDVRRKQARERIRELLDQVRLPEDAVDRYPNEFLRRSAAADRHRPSPRPRAAADRVRRTGVGARPVDPGARPRPLHRHPGADRGGIPVHLPRPVGCAAHQPPRGRHVPGEIVEHGQGKQVTMDPSHPYTKRLLMAAPVANPKRQAARRQVWLDLTRSTTSAAG